MTTALLDNKWKKKEPISKCDCDMPQCQMGSKESLVSLLQQGHLVGLSPGGTYEAQMGDNMYKLMWRARSGFARVVEEVGEVPVIPVFTQNVREAYRTFLELAKYYKWKSLSL